MPRNNFSKRPHLKIDFAKRHRDKVSSMYKKINDFKSISGASLIEELEVTPTKFYFIQRDCIDLNPIRYDKKTRLYSLEQKPQIKNDLAEIKNDLAKIQNISGYELKHSEKQIIKQRIKEQALRITEKPINLIVPKMQREALAWVKNGDIWPASN